MSVGLGGPGVQRRVGVGRGRAPGRGRGRDQGRAGAVRPRPARGADAGVDVGTFLVRKTVQMTAGVNSLIN